MAAFIGSGSPGDILLAGLANILQLKYIILTGAYIHRDCIGPGCYGDDWEQSLLYYHILQEEHSTKVP